MPRKVITKSIYYSPISHFTISNSHRLAVNKNAALRAKILNSPNFRRHMNSYLQTRLYDMNFNLYASITLSLQKWNVTNILGIETDKHVVMTTFSKDGLEKALKGFKNLLRCYKTHGISLCFPIVWNMRGISSIKFGVQKLKKLIKKMLDIILIFFLISGGLHSQTFSLPQY